MGREPKQSIVEVAAKLFLGRWAVVLTICLFSTTSALAQNKSEAVASEQPAINFQALAHRTIDLGDHSTHLNRMAPPVAPPAPPPNRAQIAAAKAAEASPPPEKKYKVLFLSTTVYDRKVTEVRGSADGRRSGFSAPSTSTSSRVRVSWKLPRPIYTLMLAIENEPSAELGEAKQLGKHIPTFEKFSDTRSEYAVIEEDADAAPAEAMLTTLDALHVYFDANEERLTESYTHREKARTGEQRRLQEHPPVPQDVVIHYRKNDFAPMPANNEESAR